MDESVVRRNVDQQVEWYGEPVGDTVRRVTAGLGLTQGQLAGVVGLSAPMLSQLSSGQRAKIANPSVLSRLQSLAQLAPESASLSRGDLAARIEAVRAQDSTGVLTTGGASPGRGPEAVQALLRAVASAADVAAAAALLDDDQPALAQVLRVYGLGRTAQAREHWAVAVGT